jgi:SAM-dependent methyltransferase
MSERASDDWLDAATLYSAMAADYDASFGALAHRRAYDRLAGEIVGQLLPAGQGLILDIGCGTGRWAQIWLSLGHNVIGVERAQGMIDALTRRELGEKFSLMVEDMEMVDLSPGTADLVVAMGSVQYARDPTAMIRRFASWAKPGGAVCIYVDSLVALVLDLIRIGKRDEALMRLRSRRGVFTQGGHQAELHLYDRQALVADFKAAGLVDIQCRGLLVSSSAWGSEGCAKAMAEDEEGALNLDRRLSEFPVMADTGKHLIAWGRRP